MKGIYYFLVLTLASAVSFSGCVLLKQTTSVPSYSENISVYRTKYDGALKTQEEEIKEDTVDIVISDTLTDITDKLDTLLTGLIEKNAEVEYVQGYTIQVYSGASREGADMAKSEVYKLIPEARPKVNWEAPNYKVKVGAFLEKIEAQKFYSQLKKHLAQAIIIPTRIPNNTTGLKN